MTTQNMRLNLADRLTDTELMFLDSVLWATQFDFLGQQEPIYTGKTQREKKAE